MMVMTEYSNIGVAHYIAGRSRMIMLVRLIGLIDLIGSSDDREGIGVRIPDELW